MPSIPYLLPDDRIDSDAANAIWDEFERRMALLLCGKSPLVVDGIDVDLLENRLDQAALGRVVAFFRSGSPNNRVTTRSMNRYDHSIYDAAVADASIGSQDDARHIVWVTGATANLDESLAAHTISLGKHQYYVGVGDYPAAYVRPERRHRYAVAEVIVENQDDLLIPDTWDKYGFWRIHNVDRTLTLSVRFGEHHAMTVAPMECITVRRDTATTGYVTGKYFWRRKPGDPSFYNAGPAATRFPERGMMANNVVNPAILFHWVRLLTSPNVREQFGWDVDLSGVIDQYDAYAERYGDPASDQTAIGDLLWHKGTAKVAVMAAGGGTVWKDAEWKGANKPPAGPLKRTRNPDGSVTIESTETDPCDLVGVTTNVAATVTEPGRAAAALPITLPAAVVNLGVLSPQAREDQTVTVSHVPLGSSTYRYEDYHYDAFADPVIRTRAFGPTPLVGDLRGWIRGAWGTIGNGWLSPNGFRWEMTRQVDWSLPGFRLPAVYSVGIGSVTERDHVTIGLGWPGNEYPSTLHVPCRINRHAVPMVESAWGWLHPDFSGVDLTVDGADYAIPQPPLPGDESEISLQTLVAPAAQLTADPPTELSTAQIAYWYAPQPPDNVAAILGKVSDPDWYRDNRTAALGGYSGQLEAAALGAPRMLRVPMLAEHYNHMAWMVNSLTRCRPLCVEDVAWGVNGAVWRFAANELGLLDAAGAITSIRPVTQYAGVNGLAVDEAAYRSLGIPIHTEADLPEAWRDANTAWKTSDTHNTWRINLRKRYGTGTVKSEGAFLEWRGWYECPYTWTYLGIARIRSFRGDLETVPTSPFVFGDQACKWVDIDDVAAFAASRGLAFIHAVPSRPLKVVQLESATPAILPWSLTTANGLYRGAENLEDAQWKVEAFAQYYLDLIEGTTVMGKVEFDEPALSIRLAETDNIDDADLIASPDFVDVTDEESNGDQYFITREPGERRQRSVFRWLQSPTETGSYLRLAFVEGVPPEIRSIDALELRTLRFDPEIIGAATDASVALLTSVHTVTRQADFATLGNDQYEHEQRFQRAGRPPVYHPPNAAGSRMDRIEAGVIACGSGERAFVATIIPEITVSLLPAS